MASVAKLLPMLIQNSVVRMLAAGKLIYLQFTYITLLVLEIDDI